LPSGGEIVGGHELLADSNLAGRRLEEHVGLPGIDIVVGADAKVAGQHIVAQTALALAEVDDVAAGPTGTEGDFARDHDVRRAGAVLDHGLVGEVVGIEVDDSLVHLAGDLEGQRLDAFARGGGFKVGNPFLEVRAAVAAEAWGLKRKNANAAAASAAIPQQALEMVLIERASLFRRIVGVRITLGG
jgi:hypothetical protein